MSIALIAFLYAIGFGLVAGVLACIRSSSFSLAATLCSGGITTILIFSFDWLFFFKALPPFLGSGHILIIVLNLVFVVVVCAIVDGISSTNYDTSIGAAWPLALVLLLIIGVVSIFKSQAPLTQSGADKLASQIHVTTEKATDYPNTDTNHIRIVSVESAQSRAHSALGSASASNLSTLYSVSDGVLQSVDDHLYYLFPLDFNSRRVANSQHHIVPGYIVVDAEDPNTPAKLRTGYKMIYTAGDTFEHKLNRYVYDHGYRNSYLDDFTLEVDDQWNPFYTASLNKPALGWTQAVPVAMIIVDPQTGTIKKYGTSSAPEWVDRVYSASVVKQMMNWWGEWGAGKSKAPFSNTHETSANRYAVSGDPVLLYTKSGHPAWEMLLTSYNSDTAASYVALFDARDNEVKLYKPEVGLSIESTVYHSFKSANANRKSYEPVDIALHSIYGQLTWVVSYISSSGNNVAFQGVGLLQASDVNGANVVFSTTKADALDQYRSLLASGDQNAAPDAGGMTKSAQGTISRVVQITDNGNTYIEFVLTSDPAHLYRAKVSDNEPELPFAVAGAKIRVTYLDTGASATRRDVSAYDDLGLELTK